MLCDQNTYQTPFKCIGPIFTTWRSFSLLRIPSRRPRVMPATFSSFVPLIMWLSAKQQVSKKKKNLFPIELLPTESTYPLDELHTLPSLPPGSRGSPHLPIMWLSLGALLPEGQLDRYHQRRTLVAEHQCCSHTHSEVPHCDCSLDNDQNNHRSRSGFGAYQATAATEPASGHP